MERRMVVVMNGAAGALLDRPGGPEELRRIFADHGLHPDFVPPGGSLPERIERAMASAPEILVAAGGDGTVACAAGRLAGTACTLGILPFGTMNLLAHDLGIPVGDTAAAIAVLAAGKTRRIDIGDVNGQVFLCASMLGLPARLARHREARRGAGPAAIWNFSTAVLRAMTRQFRMRVDVGIDGRPAALRVPSLTIMPGSLDPASGRMFGRSRLDGGELVVYVVARLRLADLLRLAARLLGGRLLGTSLADDAVVQELRGADITISRRRGAMRVMNDGEVTLMTPPLHYRIRPQALQVLAPPAAAL